MALSLQYISVPEWLPSLPYISVPEWLPSLPYISVPVHSSVPEWLNHWPLHWHPRMVPSLRWIRVLEWLYHCSSVPVTISSLLFEVCALGGARNFLAARGLSHLGKGAILARYIGVSECFGTGKTVRYSEVSAIRSVRYWEVFKVQYIWEAQLVHSALSVIR